MWKDLTMSQRADMMDLYLSKGITSLDDMRSLYDSSISDTAQGTSFSDGGSIHIKPENRGKFTALKKRTGHSATWFKEHGTPAQKKMATFALNARHWKHGLGGNLYEEGGPEKKWKALDNIDFVTIPDTSFTRDKTGVGSIEYFDSRYPEGITYPNGYHREHPLPGKDVILYNPNDNDKQDIRLDALHIMPKDATYDTLYSQYLDEIYTGQAGDLAWKGVKKWEDDAKKYGKNNIDTKNQYIRNEADGLLRNSLIEGDSDYRKQKGYSASKSDAIKEFPTLAPYVDAIQNYLVTGERPANILPEITVTGKKRRGKKYGYGGHIYDGTSEDTQQMNIGGGPFSYIQRMLSEAQNMSRFARKPSYEEALRQAGKRVERQKDISTTVHNDNTWVAGRHGKKKNSELQESKAETLRRAGALEKQFRQDHPYLAFARDAITAAPLAVAAYPFVAGAGELAYGLGSAAAATTAGQTLLPWIDAGLTSYFGAHGLNHAINEGIDGWGDAAMTALEITPLGRLVKPMWNAGKSAVKNWYKGLESDIVNITESNAHSIPLEEWNRQFRAAYAAGDREKGQRLWDLWYKTRTPGNKAIESSGKATKSYHTVGDKYDPHFNSFDTSIEGFDSSVYTTDNPFMSGTYSKELTSEAERSHIVEKTRLHLMKQYEKDTSDIGKELYDFYKNHPEQARKKILQDHKWLNGDVNPDRQKQLYTYLREPVEIDAGGKGWSTLPLHTLPDDVYKAIKPDMRLDALTAGYSTRSLEEAQKAAGHYDGAIIHNVVDYGGAKRYGSMSEPNTVYMVNDPRYVKSAEPFTLADDGSLIDLTDRANFNINDLRYGLIPFGIGLTGYGLYNSGK